MINQIETMNKIDQEILDKWKEIADENTLLNIDVRLDRLCSIYAQVNGSDPTEKIKRKIKFQLQCLAMETIVAEFEKTSVAN